MRDMVEHVGSRAWPQSVARAAVAFVMLVSAVALVDEGVVSAAGVPAAPTRLVASPRTGAAVVAFLPGSANGSTITNYQYSLNGGSWRTLSPADATSPIRIPGLTNGLLYGVRLRAINKFGAGGASASVAVRPSANPVVPGAPTYVVVQRGSTGRTATVAFWPGSDGGAAISTYQYSLNSGTWRSLPTPDATSPITVPGLSPGTTYGIRIRAMNAKGAGAASASASVTMFRTPGAPSGLTAVPGNGVAQVSFTAGANGGVTITNYQYSLDGGTWTPLSPADAASPVTISGLTNGAPHGVQLRAVNSVGAGAASASVTVTPGVPASPVPTGSTVGDSSASIAFAEPAFTGGDAITNYQFSLDGGPWQTPSPAVTTSPLPISGLVNGQTYSVRVRTMTPLGVSAPSAPISVTPITTPSAPTNLSVVPGDGTATVSFVQPFNGGATVTNYQYSVDGGAWTTANLSSSPLQVGSLTNLQTYTVRVRALNAAGPGQASASVSVTPGKPAPPTAVVASIGNGSVSVSFTAPAFDGGAPVTSLEYSLDGGPWTTAAQATSPITIAGLSNGTTYGVRLRAVTSIGVSDPTSSVPFSPATTPAAPVVTSVTAGNGVLSVLFGTSFDGGRPVTSLEYSFNGVDWQQVGPPSAGTPLDIGGLTNGTSYSVRFRAVNAIGVGASSAPVSAIPGTPTEPPQSITASFDFGTAIFDFTPGAAGAAAINGYQYSLDGGATWLGAYVNNPFQVWVLGLTNGTTYSVLLRATNQFGPGPASVPLTGTPYSTPSAPTGFSVSSGPNYLTLSFGTPFNDGGLPITNYAYSLDGGSSWTRMSPATTVSPIVLTGLSTGREVAVRIAAVNARGIGTASPATWNVRISSYSDPTNVMAVSNSSTTATLSFTPPDNTTGLIEYMVSFDGVSWGGTGSTQSPVTLTGLTPGATYSIRLAGRNSLGIGSASIPVSIKVGAPGAPQAVTATTGTPVFSYFDPNNGFKAVFVYPGIASWSPALWTGGSAITYTARWYDQVTGAVLASCSTPATGTSCQSSVNFSKGAGGWVSVSASNASFSGPESPYIGWVAQ